MPRQKKTSIRELAEMLSVSPATVSLVLNNRAEAMRISPDTQQRVLEKAMEMGVSVNKTRATARNPKLQRALPTFCVFWPVMDITYTNEDAAGIARIYKAILQYQKTTTTDFNCVFQPYVTGQINDISKFISGNYYDGVIMVGLCDDDLHFLEEKTWEIPIILYNRSSNNFASVITDEYETGAIVAKHFKDRGHKTFSIVFPSVISQNYSLKRSGFIDFLLTTGIERKNIYVASGSLDNVGGFSAMEELFEKNKIPTAIFCTDDRMVTGVYKSLFQHNVKIPEEIEVVTSGDHEWNSYLMPSVTSITPPVTESMHDCLNLLLQFIKTDDPGNITLLSRSQYCHAVQLVYRESSPKPGTVSEIQEQQT